MVEVCHPFPRGAAIIRPLLRCSLHAVISSSLILHFCVEYSERTPHPVKLVHQMEDDADAYASRRRTLVIRHSSGDRIVALLEILSPGNKRQQEKLDRFVDKAVSALYTGYHLLVVDVLPPGRFDPQGIHGVIWSEFDSAHPYQAPSDRPMTLAAYAAGERRRAYVEPVGIGGPLPKMPLFLTEDRYVDVPLEATYQEAYASMPERWRRVIEGRE